MLQIVEQTKEEKMAMYMKLTKKQIAEMLINCNDIVTALTPVKNCVIPDVSGSLPTNHDFWEEWNKHKDIQRLWFWMIRRHNDR